MSGGPGRDTNITDEIRQDVLKYSHKILLKQATSNKKYLPIKKIVRYMKADRDYHSVEATKDEQQEWGNKIRAVYQLQPRELMAFYRYLADKPETRVPKHLIKQQFSLFSKDGAFAGICAAFSEDAAKQARAKCLVNIRGVMKPIHNTASLPSERRASVARALAALMEQIKDAGFFQNNIGLDYLGGISSESDMEENSGDMASGSMSAHHHTPKAHAKSSSIDAARTTKAAAISRKRAEAVKSRW